MLSFLNIFPDLSNATNSKHSTLSHVRRFITGFVLKAEEAQQAKAVSKEGKVVVAGGTGFIGNELVKLLQRRGYDVLVVSRYKDPFKLTWDELEQKGLPEDTKAVVNLAGQNVLDYLHRWKPAFRQMVYDSRVGTAKKMATAILKLPKEKRPKAFVQISGVGYYDPSITEYQDEYSEGGKHDFFAKLVVDWENAAKLPEECGVRNVFIRSGVVLGRQGGMIAQIITPFCLGLGGVMGSGEQMMPWIHVKDLSRLILHSIENEKVSGVLNGVAPQTVTNQQFVKAFAKALQRPAFFPMPEFVFNLMYGEERASMITKGPSVLPRRTTESGFNYKYGTIKEACKEFSFYFYSDPDEISKQ